MLEYCTPKRTSPKNIARIVNAVQVTNPQCHVKSFSTSNKSLNRSQFLCLCLLRVWPTEVPWLHCQLWIKTFGQGAPPQPWSLLIMRLAMFTLWKHDFLMKHWWEYFDQPIAEVGRTRYTLYSIGNFRTYTRWGFSYEAPFRQPVVSMGPMQAGRVWAHQVSYEICWNR